MHFVSLSATAVAEIAELAAARCALETGSTAARLWQQEHRESAAWNALETLVQPMRSTGSGTTRPGVAEAASLLDSYAQLAGSLLKNFSGLCLLDGELKPRGQSAGVDAMAIVHWLSSLHWDDTGNRASEGFAYGRGQWLSAVPLEQSDGMLLGVFCIQQSLSHPPMQPSRHASAIATQLRPLLDCLLLLRRLKSRRPGGFDDHLRRSLQRRLGQRAGAVRAATPMGVDTDAATLGLHLLSDVLVKEIASGG
jgi:hypothetical protein